MASGEAPTLGGNQMSLINDTEEVIHFLKNMGKKTVLDSHAVQCRLTACQNLFSVLEEGETHTHYILSNLGEMVKRYKVKQPDVKASTLKVYKSRVKSSLEDFEAWSLNRKVWEKTRLEQSEESRTQRKQKVAAIVSQSVAETNKRPRKVSGNCLSISLPLAKGRQIDIQIPEDGLTSKELLQLGMSLFPYCQDSDSRTDRNKLSHLH